MREINMVRCIRAAVVLGAIALFAVCTAPAPAAKGVKKTGIHQVSGKVVAVNHGKKGHGTVTIQVMHHRQKKGAAVRRQPVTTQTFTVGHTTHIHTAANVRRGLASLHAGEHVTIMAHRQHADRITIHAVNRVVRR
jgi:hypothetical protein